MMGDCGNAEVVEFSDGRSRCLGTVGGEESVDVHIEKNGSPAWWLGWRLVAPAGDVDVPIW